MKTEAIEKLIKYAQDFEGETSDLGNDADTELQELRDLIDWYIAVERSARHLVKVYVANDVIATTHAVIALEQDLSE